MLDWSRFFKFGIFAVVAVFLFAGIHWYGNRQWSKGEEQGRQAMASTIEKQKQMEWARREKELAAAETEVAEKIEALRYITARMIQERADLQKSLKAEIGRLQDAKMADYQAVAAVADDEIWERLRAVSGELAAYSR